MNEKPKSILKRQFHVPRLILTWTLYTVLIVLVLVIAGAVLNDEPAKWFGGFAPFWIFSIVGGGILLGIVCFIRWVWCWRNCKRTLFGLACLFTLIALFYAEEDFRGQRAWNNFKQEWEAKGERFDLASFIPPPVPDEQNFAMTPLLRPIYDFDQTTNGVRWRDTNGIAHLDKIGIWASDVKIEKAPNLAGLEQEKLTDLAAWQKYYQSSTNFPQSTISGTAAQDILVALGKFDVEMSELRDAATARPASRFPIHYGDEPPFGILLPHLGRMKGLCQLFLLRSIALMELGRGEESLTDVQMAFRLSDSIHDEPFLIDHLVRIAALSISLQGVREGLARHVWNDAQLARLEKYLGTLDILAEARNNRRGERSLNLAGLEYYRRVGFRGPPDETVFSGDDGGVQNSPSFLRGFRVFPSGFSYQNMLTIARLHQEFTLGAIDEKQHRVFPDIANGLTNAIGRMRITPYNLFGKMLMPAFAHSSMKSARSQTFVDEALVACALERHRLAHGQLPDTLTALVPQFLEKIPTDVIDGQPLRYRKNADGSYLLYSIGWNQKDDGGTRVMTKGATPSVDEKQSDWVWELPAK